MTRAAASERWQRRARRLARSPLALPGLFVASLLETLIIPVPIELVLIPWMAAERDRLWRLAGVALAGCIAASLVGYAVGRFLLESVGRWFLTTYGYTGAYEQFAQYFDTWGFLAILLVGVTPVPFQSALLVAGAAGYPLALFVLAALIARGTRYYGLALLVWRFGPAAAELWRANRARAAVVFVIGVMAAVGVARLIADL